MQRYSSSQLAIIIAVPTVTVLLLWTLVIFYKNRKQWRPYDIAIVAILIQSVLRNLSTLAYTVLTILQTHELSPEYCTAAVWLFNSLHTFQASTLSTLSVIGLYSVNLYKKRKEIKQYLNTVHIGYHLFCLTTLCACVGVAAILARHEWSAGDSKSANFEFTYGKNITQTFHNGLENCQFMPYQLDIKYNVFILSLHALLACISAICFVGIIFKYYRTKGNRFDYLKKSTSDLSDLSLGAAASTVNPKDEIAKIYYDSYQKPHQEYMQSKQDSQNGTKQETQWNSDTSNISTSVSSTNSRRPCLKQTKKENTAGLESILPVLVVCYLFNHLPVVVLCLFPWLVHPWSAAGAALWLALVQDVMLPAGMALVDERFSGWISRVYRCSSRRKKQSDKLPHGLDGKFRPFSSTTQAVKVQAPVIQARPRPITIQQDHKFPITNGSLYTSIDGHLPIIHNYRRHKGLRSPVQSSISMGLHSTYIKRQESILNHQLQPPIQIQQTETCDDSFISLPADYTSLSSNYAEMTIPTDNISRPHPLQKQMRHLSASQNSLRDISLIENELRRMRHLSKSQDNLNEVPITVIQRDIQNFRNNPEIFQQQNITTFDTNKDQESSDEEYFTTQHSDLKNYDTISSESCCSITTEANCDFEFFGKQKNNMPTSNESSMHQTYQFPKFDYQFKNNDNSSYIMQLTSNTSLNNINNPVMRSFKPFISQNDISRKNSKSPKSNRALSDKDLNKNFRITRSNSKRSLNDLDNYIQNNKPVERSNSNRSYDLLRTRNEDTYIVRSNSNRSNSRNKEIMSSFPNIPERKTNISYLNLKNLNSSCIHFNDYKNNEINENSLDKQKKTIPVLSVESLCSILNHRGISYLDNGDICNHNYGGSVPDFKKIFVSEYI